MTQASDIGGTVGVVTGGSGAIGQAIASALQAADTNALSLNVVPSKDPNLPRIQCDVRDDVSVANAIREGVSIYGGIDIAVHAVGVSRDAVVWKLPEEDWDLVQSVNLRGALLLTRQTLHLMRRRALGRIVLIGSINGSRGKFGTAAYSASKAGLLDPAKSVAREAGRFGIRINVIEPGPRRKCGRLFRGARRRWPCCRFSLRPWRPPNYRANLANRWWEFLGPT